MRATQLLKEAITFHRRGDFASAKSMYEKILQHDSAHADARHLLGVLAHQQGQHEEAVGHIQEAIDLKDNAASYHSNLGAAYRELGQLEQAIASFQKAIELDPLTAGYHYNLGNALKDIGEIRQAIQSYKKALQLEPNFAEAWNNLGDAHKQVGELESAMECHQRAVNLRPVFPEAWFNMGNALRAMDQLDEANASYRKALKQNPEFTDAWINLGYTLEDQAQIENAISAYERAISVQPDSADARLNRALAWLRQEKFSTGWDEYEFRWQRPAKKETRPKGVEWNGEPLAGKSIFVYGEQGIGDQLMFASCLPDLQQRKPEQVTVSCDSRLIPLLSRSFPNVHFQAVETLVGQGDTAAQLQIALGSLPRLVRQSRNDFPNHHGYLKPDEPTVLKWRKRFQQLGSGPIIGISWRGGSDPVVKRRRSIPLEQWQELFRLPSLKFVNLQYGNCREELETLQVEQGLVIHDWDDANPLENLDDLAARIAACDLVISVDNSTVHMAGALGVPVWNLLHFAADWRWFINRTKSLWYPSMRLIQQPEWGDWNSVFQQVINLLESEMISEKTPGTSVNSNRSHELNLQGNISFEQKRISEAIACFEAALEENPENVETLNNLAIALQENGEHQQALVHLQRACELAPGNADLAYNLGNLYRHLNCPHEAVESYQAAYFLQPQNVQIAVNRGVALREAGRLQQAEAAFDEVIQSHPHLPEPRFNRALVRLQRGDFQNGWPEYEWRWKTGETEPTPPAVLSNLAELAGRKCLIRAEQGLGDEIMFASCLPDVMRVADSCIVECDARLVSLFQRSFPGAVVVSKPVDLNRSIVNPQTGQPVEWDLHVPIGSLPGLFRTHLNGFPKWRRYLVANPAQEAGWKTRLAKLGGEFHVGISWSGGKDAETRSRRSVPLLQWKTLFELPAVRFINLQYGVDRSSMDRITRAHSVQISHWDEIDPLTELDDFAALIRNLDLVISIDNSTVHFAGALGTPVWTLLDFSADWRWMFDRDDSPWYPCMRLFRQESPRDWTRVMNQVVENLSDWLRVKKTSAA